MSNARVTGETSIDNLFFARCARHRAWAQLAQLRGRAVFRAVAVRGEKGRRESMRWDPVERLRAIAHRQAPTRRISSSLACALIAALGGSSVRAENNSPLADARDSFWKEQAPARFVAKFQTSKGEFAIEAHREWAPHGVDRFYNLVRAGFFNDSRFFRVRAGFIAQFGIAGEPAIAARWKEERIPDDSVRASNTRGTIAFAMTGPNTRTTQLFISLADNSRLDAEGFAPIGRVVEGMEVVDALHSGYGEDSGGGMRGGKQQRLFAEGNAYLDREFPKLDRIEKAFIWTPR